MGASHLRGCLWPRSQAAGFTTACFSARRVGKSGISRSTPQSSCRFLQDREPGQRATLRYPNRTGGLGP